MGTSKSLLISIVLTAFAILLIYTYVDQEKARFQAGLGTLIPVMVAKQNIPENVQLEEFMFEVREVPKKFVQPNFISSPADIKDTVSAVPIAEGETLTTTKLLFLGLRSGLAPIISRNKRAVSVRATPVTTVGNLIKPGDRVDIIAVFDVPDGAQMQTVVRTTLQDVLVLSIGEIINNQTRRFEARGAFNACIQVRTNEQDSRFNNVTLEVTPKEAQTLIGLSQMAQLYYSLRNPNDRDTGIIVPTTTRELTGR
jgi:pilus assembly protein CpaB